MRRGKTAQLVLGLVVLACPGAARAATFTGKTKPKTTVVAIAKDGRSWSTVAGKSGAFSLSVKASPVTLQLRDAAGRYAGPVVVGGSGTRALLGVRGSAKLGKLAIRKGAAFLSKPLSSRFVDKRISAKAIRGVPVGAGKLGFGGTPTSGASAAVILRDGRAAQDSGPAGLKQPGADPDVDGLPNAIDVDDNGNKIVDAVDPSLSSRDPGGSTSFTQMFLGLEMTTNIDADPGSAAAIETRMKEKLSLVLLNVPVNTKLDCGGLSWCSPGGSGHLETAGANGLLGPGSPFPSGADTTMPIGPTGEFRMLPGGGPTDVRAGDTLIQKRSDGTEQTIALGFVFATIPAIKSWSTGAGAGGEVAYPVAAGAPGTNQNPVTVAPGPDGRRTLTIEFWRPQRASLPGVEPNGFVDIGHLLYQANVPQSGGGSPGRVSPQCPVSSLTAGPGLVSPTVPQQEGLVDTSGDEPSSAARTLKLTVDLDACAASKGTSLAPGQMIPFDLGAYAPRQTSVDHANQTFVIRVG